MCVIQTSPYTYTYLYIKQSISLNQWVYPILCVLFWKICNSKDLCFRLILLLKLLISLSLGHPFTISPYFLEKGMLFSIFQLVNLENISYSFIKLKNTVTVKVLASIAIYFHH